MGTYICTIYYSEVTYLCCPYWLCSSGKVREYGCSNSRYFGAENVPSI